MFGGFCYMEHLEFDLKELHNVQLALFKKFDLECKKHGMSYFLGFGSLLGAIREQKIIEWDDGIDIVMPYKDYEKLTCLPQASWGSNYFMQTYDTDICYNKYYAKLRNSSTTLILAEDADRDMNHGIPINIYPIINLSDNKDERLSQIRNAKIYKAVTEGVPVQADNILMHAFSAAFIEVATVQQKNRIRDYLKNEVLKFENKNTNCCFALAGTKSLDLVLFKKWFSSSEEWDFEGMKVKIPSGWNEWLKLRYGDYMKTPIAELQGSKISDFITLNTHKPYTYYKGKTYCV